MSYQVLARKWRPRVFREMVGQEHVLKALINALDHERLHHAYLFTGTRGVGKTTIARILAKCLNCEIGVSSEPCDQCAACCEINEGRFVDLIEVDAASRTKVEDTRELLDNVQYAPTKGRYKVYLIDEVHMLSGHSFNALLKTLEEPPPHVKFLLATTDPQKLPVTILSRCLQFNLKNMSPERIVEHLQHVLEREMIPFEASALWQLGRSADGSMRDALSLTDQAIAFGNGKVTEAEVAEMLGSVDQHQVYDIVRALADSDGQRMLRCVDALSEHSPDYAEALASLIGILHRLAIAQVLPEAIDNTFGDREEILALARQLPAEDVQLFYQTALLGRRDLSLAPEPRGGFEMVLLRMLAFKPQSLQRGVMQGHPGLHSEKSQAEKSPGEQFAGESLQKEAKESAKKPEVPAPQSLAVGLAPTADAPTRSGADSAEASAGEQTPESRTSGQQSPAREREAPAGRRQTHAIEQQALAGGRQTHAVEQQAPADGQQAHIGQRGHTEQRDHTEQRGLAAVQARQQEIITLPALTTANWHQLAEQIPASGVIQNTVRNCQLVENQAQVLHFILDERNSTLYDESHQQRLADILSEYFAEPVRVAIRVGQVNAETPAATSARLQSERQAQALNALQNDPLVQDLIHTFSATLKEESVTPLDGI
jgi:DNA polymerase III subunit gamma/tau